MIKKYSHYSIILLMLSGWFLNGKYYFSRYISEGFDDWLSIIIAITLVVFASFCFSSSHKMKEKNKRLWKWVLRVIYAGLAVYSINCTTAGQYWDQQVLNESINKSISEKENQQYLLSEYQDKKEFLNKEINRLIDMQSRSVKDLDDVWSYENEYNQNEEKIKSLRIELSGIEKKIEDILNQNKISAKADNIEKSKQLYEFYNKKNPELIQFFFQLMLSIFIESIAQVSIYIFMQFDNKQKNLKVYSKDYQISRDKIQIFCAHAWKDIENNQGNYILTKNKVVSLSESYIQDENKRITDIDYDHITMTGLKSGLLKRVNGNIKPSDYAKTSEVFYNKILDLIGD